MSDIETVIADQTDRQVVLTVLRHDHVKTDTGRARAAEREVLAATTCAWQPVRDVREVLYEQRLVTITHAVFCPASFAACRPGDVARTADGEDYTVIRKQDWGVHVELDMVVRE